MHNNQKKKTTIHFETSIRMKYGIKYLENLNKLSIIMIIVSQNKVY